MTEEEKFKRNKKELLKVVLQFLKENSNRDQHQYSENILPSINENTPGYNGKFSRN